MFYNLARIVMRVVLLILRRWEVTGLDNIPSQGGLIVVSNHSSYWDPVAVGCALNRPVHYMAKAELFKIPVFGTVIRALKAFPVQRSRMDRAALRKAAELLNKGQVLGIFPEGTRSSSGELQKPHLGAAMLAFKNNVPVVPIGICGAKGICEKLKLTVGEPILLPRYAGNKPSRRDLERYSCKIMSEIARLMKPVKGDIK
ncbi:1-acyl-sn-glycerol-3-phosphate acyltransferase [Desulfohalotomaculum tongense]|uniref:lysophospholipid acyltransferase family protein n=1 Tax=Desulforadius tongensis TaxID=1216062 RepID=UPI001959851B|nr:lysophospholipid acyltransferase family protein [Desulforadius tongensis]MBM7854642.1 1-acyl-sn-glycerol-3-phosphate acyltransferase [Desulforadius tongensis]